MSSGSGESDGHGIRYYELRNSDGEHESRLRREDEAYRRRTYWA
jgi:hypothetical protein